MMALECVNRRMARSLPRPIRTAPDSIEFVGSWLAYPFSEQSSYPYESPPQKLFAVLKILWVETEVERREGCLINACGCDQPAFAEGGLSERAPFSVVVTALPHAERLANFPLLAETCAPKA
jgi:hypothetical protein